MAAKIVNTSVRCGVRRKKARKYSASHYDHENFRAKK